MDVSAGQSVTDLRTGGPHGRVVKAANLQCSKSLVISPLGGQVVFIGVLPFLPHLTDLAQNE